MVRGVTEKQYKTNGHKTGLTCTGIFLKIQLCRGVGCLIWKVTWYLYQYNKNITNVMRCTSLSSNDINSWVVQKSDTTLKLVREQKIFPWISVLRIGLIRSTILSTSDLTHPKWPPYVAVVLHTLYWSSNFTKFQQYSLKFRYTVTFFL